MRAEINLIFEDKAVDFLPMRGRHMGERNLEHISIYFDQVSLCMSQFLLPTTRAKVLVFKGKRPISDRIGHSDPPARLRFD